MAAGLGEMAAFGTALCWGISNQIQGAAARTIGSTEMTLLRMPYQGLILLFACFIAGEAGFVFTLEVFWLLTMSGVLGICCCDFMLYRAITLIGPSMAVLPLSLGAGFSAAFGWLFLGETMPLQAVCGVAVTTVGIVCVITEHSGSTLMPGQAIPKGKILTRGVLLALGASLTLSVSFIFLKKAMLLGVTPLWATFIRMLTGAGVLWAIGLYRGWARSMWTGLNAHPKLYWILFFSCLCGTAGMWLSSVAIDLTSVGIAATLIGLQPVMVTIVGALWYRKPPGLRVVVGSLIAFCGTALVCLR